MYLEIKSIKDGIKEREHIKNLLYLIILVIKIMKYLYFTFLNSMIKDFYFIILFSYIK